MLDETHQDLTKFIDDRKESTRAFVIVAMSHDGRVDLQFHGNPIELVFLEKCLANSNATMMSVGKHTRLKPVS